ncbi:S1C family serine protease [Spongorhabdus nitratireducens]
MKKFLTYIGMPALAGLVVGFLLLLLVPEFSAPLRNYLASQIPAAPQGDVVSWRDAVDRASPAVVSLYSQRPPSSSRYQEYRPPASLGSGVIVKEDGYILTNNHVVNRAGQILVALKDGRETSATIVGIDAETDLAVLKINLSDAPVLPLANSDPMRTGDVVLAIGNPFRLGQTVTQGIVSARGRELRLNTYEDFIQTDAAINPGNSGGALVDARGNLIGISTALLSRDGGSQGLGFAIPSNLARYVLESIISEGRVIRGWLGIESQPITPDLAKALGVSPTDGIIIARVYPDTPASQAGLHRGDVILSINGQGAGDPRKVMNRVALQMPGDKINMQVLRDGEKREVELVVSVRPNVVQ